MTDDEITTHLEPAPYDPDVFQVKRRMSVPPPGTYRVTVHDDGTVEVVALRGRRPRDSSYAPAWVDVPAAPEDGARD